MAKTSRRHFLAAAGLMFAAALCDHTIIRAANARLGVYRQRTLWSMGGWNQLAVEAQTEDIALRALDAAVNAIRRVDRTCSVHDRSSELARVNASADCQLHIEESVLRNGLEGCLEWARNTNGAFDPTIEPLMGQWGFRDAPVSREDLAIPRFDFRNTRYDSDRAILHRDSATLQFDPGGWAKGVAAQHAVEAALRAGARNAQANCGCDLYRRDSEDDSWECLIRDPNGGRTETCFRCRHSYPAVATSANNESYRIGPTGERVGHLMDPKTRRPARSDLVSVTVFGDDGLATDAVASALFVMGADEAESWLKTQPRFGAVLLGHGWQENADEVHVHGDIDARRIV